MNGEGWGHRCWSGWGHGAAACECAGYRQPLCVQGICSLDRRGVPDSEVVGRREEESLVGWGEEGGMGEVWVRWMVWLGARYSGPWVQGATVRGRGLGAWNDAGFPTGGVCVGLICVGLWAPGAVDNTAPCTVHYV